MSITSIKKTPIFRFIALTVLIAFAALLPEQPGYAQVAIVMPPVGQMVHVTSHFEPPQMVGLKIDLKDPFSFDFIMDKGETPMPDDVQKEEFNKIVKYFLVSLAMPNKDMWVNLSPYESKRIVPEVFGQTEMGHDLLAQDYVLKQFTASLMYPENELGKKFWNRIYEEAQSRFGTTDISVNTFNKVWIVADKADIYQKDDTAVLVGSHLKVMLEQDYMAIEKNKEQFGNVPALIDSNKDAKAQMASAIVREIIIPAIEKEVNEGKSFAAVRQVYSAEIMATWFKKTLKQSLLGQVFADKSKIAGQKVRDPQAKEKIYQQYLRAYKKGVFNYIKEDPTPEGQVIPRKYFSGGVQGLDPAMVYTVDPSSAEVKDFAQVAAAGRWRRFVVTWVAFASVFASGAKPINTVHNHNSSSGTVGAVQEAIRYTLRETSEINNHLMVAGKEFRANLEVLGSEAKSISSNEDDSLGPIHQADVIQSLVGEIGSYENDLDDLQNRLNREQFDMADEEERLDIQERDYRARAERIHKEVTDDLLDKKRANEQYYYTIQGVEGIKHERNALNGAKIAVDALQARIGTLEKKLIEAQNESQKLLKILGRENSDNDETGVFWIEVVAVLAILGFVLKTLPPPWRSKREKLVLVSLQKKKEEPVTAILTQAETKKSEAEAIETDKLAKGAENRIRPENLRANGSHSNGSHSNGSQAKIVATQQVQPPVDGAVAPFGSHEDSLNELNGLVQELIKNKFLLLTNLEQLNGFKKQVDLILMKLGGFNEPNLVDITNLYKQLVENWNNLIAIDKKIRSFRKPKDKKIYRNYRPPIIYKIHSKAKKLSDILNQSLKPLETNTAEGADTKSSINWSEVRKYNGGSKKEASRSPVLAGNTDPASLTRNVGGINLSDDNLTMNVKIDGNGMPLPVQYQDKAMMDLNGLTSIIRSITPVTAQNVPALFELVK